MVKKLISYLLVLMMIFSMIHAGAEETKTELDVGYQVLFGMGIVEEPHTDEVLRGDFAKIICKLAGLANEDEKNKEWNESFFGDHAVEMELIEESDNNIGIIFSDVNSTDANYKYIAEVNRRGYMNGKGEGMFAPEEVITKIEAVKVIADMLGYTRMAQLNGGYPMGYSAIASSLGMTDGLGNINDLANYNDIAMLIYNSFNVSTLGVSISSEGTEIAPDGDKTMLTAIMKTNYCDASISDNGVTAITGTTEISQNQIKAGDMIFDCMDDKKKQEYNKLIGQKVRIYYSIDDDTYGQIRYIMPRGNNNILVIDAKDITDFDGNSISYIDGKREISKKVQPGAHMIYNGLHTDSYNSDTFDFDKGTVTLISYGDGSGYNLLIVEEYVTWYTKAFNTEENIIFNYSSDTDELTEDNSLDFTEALGNNTFNAVNSVGENVRYEELSKYNVFDIARNGNCINIIASNDVINGFKVTSTYADEDGTFISDGKQEYKLDASYENAAQKEKFWTNDTITLYLNSFGYVAWVEGIDAYDLTVGYFMRAFVDDENGDEDAYVKLLDATKTQQTYKLKKKVSFGDSETVERADYKKIEGSVVVRNMDGFTGFFAYRLNKDKEIDLIEIPLLKRAGENRLQLIYDNRTHDNVPRVQKNSFTHFGEYVFFDNNSVIWTTPPDIEDYQNTKMYSIANTNIYDTSAATKKYRMVTFTTNKDSVYAKWVDAKQESANALSLSELKFFVVTDVNETIDENDEPVTALEGMYCGRGMTGTNKTLYVRDGAGVDREGNSCNPAKKAVSIYNMGSEDKNVKYYSIKKGDIIIYSYEETSDYPTDIVLLYRGYGENPAAPNGNPGMFPESSGIYDVNDTTYKNNPFVMNYTALTSTNPKDYMGMRRFTCGYVSSINDNIAKITTQDLSAYKYIEQVGSKSEIYTETRVPLRGQSFCVVNYTPKTVTATHADANSIGNHIKSYDEYYSKCSKVIFVQTSGQAGFSFVINWSE